MARVKNITDDPLDIPSLGLFAVAPGATVEVPDAKDFKGSEMWQVTAPGTPGKRKKRTKATTREAGVGAVTVTAAGTAYIVGENGPELLTNPTPDEENPK